MKCLLCTRNLHDKNLLKNHYELKHKSDPNNWFFKALFKKNKDIFFVRKCYRCEKFLTSRTADQQSLCQDHREDQTSDSLDSETNPRKQD